MKMLASDFDSTLYVDSFEAFQKNIEAVRSFIKKGNLFCIVTGRSYTNIKPLLEKYKITYHYLICQDGAKIFDYNDFCFSTHYLPVFKIEKVLSIIRKYHFNYYLDDGYNKTNTISDCVKIAISIDNRKEAAKRFLDEISFLDVYAYLSTEHINIIDSSVNKKNSLYEVLEYENFDSSDLYVVGDDVNDLEMLTTFYGAIMKNHNEVLDTLNKKEYEYLYQYIDTLLER